jgi:GTPase SAR1 family protein
MVIDRIKSNRYAFINLLIDITRQSSFQNVDHWLKELRDHSDEKISLMLVGNKVDLAETSRAVSTDEAAQYAEDSQMMFFETSALDSTNVESAFKTVFERIYENMPKSVKTDNSNVNIPGQNTIKLSPPTSASNTNAPTTTASRGVEQEKQGGGCC